MNEMNLGLGPAAEEARRRIATRIEEEIRPLDEAFLAEVEIGDRWTFTPRQSEIIESLKAGSQREGFWNLWLTGDADGPGLTTVEYAYAAEEMGKSYLAPEAHNCSAPDTGNMDVLRRYGSEEMKTRWLGPLLAGRIRSAFLMSEPAVASSDATNIAMSCKKLGSEYVLNGEKWWASGAGDPRCAVYVVLARTSQGGSRHRQHSAFAIPSDLDGIEILRPMQVFGHDDAPHGHMHIRFSDVRVPAKYLLLEEGAGFSVVQSRLGGGRIHHCMRAIGQAEYALELLCRRAESRTAFGSALVDLGSNRDIIAQARIDIDMARLLCLRAAWAIDHEEPRSAAEWISKIKVMAPEVALRVTDQAVQIHGAAGISQDTPLARQWTYLRTMRLVDGPDAVHRRQIARAELRRRQTPAEREA